MSMYLSDDEFEFLRRRTTAASLHNTTQHGVRLPQALIGRRTADFSVTDRCLERNLGSDLWWKRVILHGPHTKPLARTQIGSAQNDCATYHHGTGLSSLSDPLASPPSAAVDLPYCPEMEPLNIHKFKYKTFVKYTDNFSDTNYIGRFQYGKLYRGEFWNTTRTSYLLVKIWDVPEIYDYELGDNEIRLMEELVLLRHEMVVNHPVMVRLFGYCLDGGHLGVAYEFKPFDSLFNLIPKDDFTWLQRIKSALGLASVLRFLHAGHPLLYKPFVVRNLDAAHMVLDEEYNLRLCDFGSINGGIFNVGTTNSGQNAVGCYGYMDLRGGDCSSKEDVFAFGVILMSLIAKRVYTEEDRRAGAPFVYEWALREFESAGGFEKETKNFSLVHESLSAECHFYPSDGHKITLLALECVNEVESERPNMKQVVRKLRKLEVVKQHAEFLGADELLVYPPSVMSPLWEW